MKGLYLSNLLLSVVFGLICIYYVDLVNYERYASFLNDSFGDNFSFNNSSRLTVEAGIICGIFLCFFLVIFISGFVKIKRLTNKVFSLIGIVFSCLLLFWDVLMLSSPSHISFDEIGIGFFFYALLVFTCSIVGLVQVKRYKMNGIYTKKHGESNLLDS